MLAHGAAFDVLTHKLCETGLPEFRGDELASFEVTRVTGGFVVMATGEDGVTERTLQGDIDATFVGQDVVIELPV